MNIEDSLRSALRPEDPGPEFTARVMARAGAEQQLRQQRVRRQLPLALAASVLVATVGLGVLLQQQAEQRRIQSAQQQLALALEITSEQLNQIQQRLSRTANEENGT